MAAIPEHGGGGAVGTAEAAEEGKNPDALVGEVHRRLHPAVAAGRPLLVDPPPVLRPYLAPFLVVELLLLICK